VLCERVRVDEKALLAALAAAGAAALPVAPAAAPAAVASADRPPPGGAVVAIDRLHDRIAGAATTRLWRARGATLLGAGLAATGDRLAVVQALAAAGLPQPRTLLACSAVAALAALNELGYPSILLPLGFDRAPVALPDRDAAEAVLEHRRVLGTAAAAVVLLRRRGPTAAEAGTAIVVGGRVVAWADTPGWGGPTTRATVLAEAAAAALGADAVAVDLAATPEGLAVWDIQPVPDVRAAGPLGCRAAAQALAALVADRLVAAAAPLANVRAA
jgi:[lysine-biosynthesis-protein LysW]--L-2-aminoadipate ligase